jgi:hypothetical protein
MSNLRQIGTAAMMYQNEHKGQLPCDASGLSNLVRFMDWNGTGTPPTPATDLRRFGIRDAMLKYMKGNAKVFFCPANNLPATVALGRPFDENDFTADNTSATRRAIRLLVGRQPLLPQSPGRQDAGRHGCDAVLAPGRPGRR